MPPASDTEVGYVIPEGSRGLLGLSSLGLPGWGTWNVDTTEHVPALKWPASIRIYDRMRSDPQVDALLRGLFTPVRRFEYVIDPDGARKEVVNALAEDLGLSVIGAKKSKKRRNRFSHKEHLRSAFLAVVYGHMFFEQVGTIEAGNRGRLLWRLRKLAPRMPHTISEIKIARDGGLEWIRQSGEFKQPTIDIGRLLVFVHEKEGANWFGRSLLRSAYQPWLLKDRLLRVDAIRHERNGMGVPIVELPERPTPDQIEQGDQLAQQYRTGMASGGAIPAGMKLTLKGVEGATSDVLASIRYHDEAMARLMLQMFMGLGGDTEHGSKALGETFIKLTAQAQDAMADWYCDTMNEYMLWDWTEWNYGPDEQPPKLIYKRKDNPELSAQQLAQLVAQGVLSVDEELEMFLREYYGLPPLRPGVRRKVTQNVPPGAEDDEADENSPPAPGEENVNVTEGPV